MYLINRKLFLIVYTSCQQHQYIIFSLNLPWCPGWSVKRSSCLWSSWKLRSWDAAVLQLWLQFLAPEPLAMAWLQLHSWGEASLEQAAQLWIPSVVLWKCDNYFMLKDALGVCFCFGCLIFSPCCCFWVLFVFIWRVSSVSGLCMLGGDILGSTFCSQLPLSCSAVGLGRARSKPGEGIGCGWGDRDTEIQCLGWLPGPPLLMSAERPEFLPWVLQQAPTSGRWLKFFIQESDHSEFLMWQRGVSRK